MYLGEGTKAGIFQSIMMKPPNVQPVYPLRDESVETRTTIDLSKSAAKTGPIVIFNTEMSDPKSVLYNDEKKYLSKFLNQLKQLGENLNGQLDVVVLYGERHEYRVSNAIKKLNSDYFTTLKTEDSYNIEFSAATK